MTHLLAGVPGLVLVLLGLSVFVNVVLFILWGWAKRSATYTEDFVIYLADDLTYSCSQVLSVEAYDALHDEANAIKTYRWESHHDA